MAQEQKVNKSQKEQAKQGCTAKERYGQLMNARSPFLDRARACAKLTIPAIMPPDGHSAASELPSPAQGLGARGVKNLASKLLLTLLPPNSPFFRLTMDEWTLEEAGAEPDLKSKIDEAFGKIERSVMSEIEGTNARVCVHEGLLHLIICGNVLLYMIPEGGLRVYTLQHYVVKRDPDGNLTEIITVDYVTQETAKDYLKNSAKPDLSPDVTKSPEKNVELYTYVKRVDGKFEAFQEIDGVEVPGTRGVYQMDDMPWMALRMNSIANEDYGRSYAEEYIGDLNTAEGLTKAIKEGAVAASKVLFMVNPNGLTDQDDIAEAPNCAVVAGIEGDVTVLQTNKQGDFMTAEKVLAKAEERLAYAFMLNTAVQRNAERVTAEEIKFVAGELEDALGGLYSILSQEFQLVYVRRQMAQMQRKGKLPKLPFKNGTVKPTIVTGLEALGRGHDLNKLVTFQRTIIESLGPEIAQKYVNFDEYIRRTGTSLGIDMKGLIKPQEEIEAAEQQAQQQAMIQSVAPNLVNAGGKIIEKQVPQAAAPKEG